MGCSSFKCHVDVVIGHVPYNLTPIFSRFLERDFNKGTVHITGEKVNRGAGYGLELPCVYRLYGPKPFVERLKKTLQEQSIID